MNPVNTSANLKLAEALPPEPEDASFVPAERSVWPGRVLLVVKIAIAASLVSWLVASGRLDFRRLAEIRLSWSAFLLVSFTLLSMFTPAIRWWYLIKIQELDIPLWPVVRATWLGYATSIFLPGAAGGDAARALVMVRGRSSGRLKMVATIVADRAIGLYTLLLLGAFSFVLCQTQAASTPAIRSLAQTSVALFLAATAVIGALLNRQTRSLTLRLLPARIASAIDATSLSYAKKRLQLAVCVVISIISHLFSMGCLVAAAGVLGIAVPIATVMSIGPLIGLANVLPLTPGGVGVGEAAADQLFSIFGVSLGADVFLLTRTLGVAFAAPAFCFPKASVPPAV